MKLGKKEARIDPRTLRISNYIPSDLPDPPPVSNWAGAVPVWGMMLNDQMGCCTCASAAHMIQGWTANEGAYFRPTNAQVLEAYSKISGYDPATRLNDNGAVELEVLSFWRKEGIAGRKIMAYATLDADDLILCKQAIHLFGGIYIGLALPNSAKGQDMWDTLYDWKSDPLATPRSWGGHAVSIIGYNGVGPICVTWGECKQMTWDFYSKYCDEAYAILSEDWTGVDRIAPNKLDLSSLQKDLLAVSH